jgi:hypothetical protein
MSDIPTFPEDDETVQATLARALELKGREADARLIQAANLSVVHESHDNWNGGTEYFRIQLKIPLDLFVQLEPSLERAEQTILETATSIWREQEYALFGSVKFFPIRLGAAGQSMPASMPASIPTFWQPKSFRLFLSHCSSQKEAVSLLSSALRVYGISGFVAHEDITPNKIWQAEIERALRTMEGLCAIISPDFCSSRWCDQEVGFALGSGKPTLAVRCGADPHGFLGKVQGLPCPEGKLPLAAPKICEALLKAPETSVSMTNALVEALVAAASFANAKAVAAAMEHIPRLEKRHAVAIRESLATNSQVSDAYGVPERLDRFLRSFSFKGIAA